jgi:hypothetical protein
VYGSCRCVFRNGKEKREEESLVALMRSQTVAVLAGSEPVVNSNASKYSVKQARRVDYGARQGGLCVESGVRHVFI